MLRDLDISGDTDDDHSQVENNLSPSTLSRLASLYSSLPLASLQSLTISSGVGS